MSADRLLAAVLADPDEPLTSELDAWLREGLRRTVFERETLADALELSGFQGKSDGPAEVRRQLRDAALLALGQALEPEGVRYRQAAAVHDAWHGDRALSDAERRLLDTAARLAGIPADLRRMLELFRRAETTVSRHVSEVLPLAS